MTSEQLEMLTNPCRLVEAWMRKTMPFIQKKFCLLFKRAFRHLDTVMVVVQVVEILTCSIHGRIIYQLKQTFYDLQVLYL